MRKHQIELRVRYDECDPMGFVHHSNYLRYFEIGRTELLRASGGRYRDMEDAGLLVVVARVDCRYRSPARYDDTLIIHTRIAKVTAAKITHEYRIVRPDPSWDDSNSTLIAEATVILGVIDREGRLQRVPDSLLEQYGEE
ncbi:Acyl-CoA thioester hydrolase YbgC [Rubripirellula obstinata]|uniref:Acyl-CoA thioester hydrolase YbgC n=1 Tax=Rubripirellula obstinata TaxID=406547 RepID=A0A5B1CNW4_9BACT|nr:thioesterase family protein [Rubripirellula obstinata]KAA1261063.1 Acyl-CoA thioester hydrolase YbgC [Rubripirellula obstinata]